MHVDVRALLRVVGAQNVVDGGGTSILLSCPLGTHGDSSPSFDIVDDPGSEKHGFWRCYGCHEGGGPVRLVKLALGLEGPGAGARAREILGRLSKVSPPGPRVGELEVSHRLLPLGAPLFSPADAWEERPLADWPGPLRHYAESRGITAEEVARWRIGISLRGRLDGRVVFPIHDEAGRLCSYTARTALGDRVRYLTPHRRENPDRAAIWGRLRWPARGSRRRCVVTEGVVNGLAIQRATGEHVGAIGGSNDSPEQWLHLATWDELVIAFDSDAPGRRASEAYRLAGGPVVRVAEFPPGLDPAELPPEETAKVVASAR